MSTGPISPLGGGFVHPLLRAHDWQDRPEFQALCQWWKEGGVGVCALVGIGGAGKTAIVERFLQVLPGGYLPHPKVPKDGNLSTPDKLLVFSVFDAPNPDTLFAELVVWLIGRYPDSPVKTDVGGVSQYSSYQQALKFLPASGKCLLVLDGLEKMQDDGSHGGSLGQILDNRLRDFVVRVADGHLPLSLIITSQYQLYDPPAQSTWYFRQIDIESLEMSAAVQLLRDRGVLGTVRQLEDIAHEQGLHALSIDLVGGYITLFCERDPARFTSTTAESEEIADSPLDPRIAAVREQKRRIARLTEQYHKTLAESDPAILALLQWICLFRLGVDSTTLAAIFAGEAKEIIAGTGLISLSKQQLNAKLKLLVEMRLIEASKRPPSEERSQIYTVHPAVRDGFLKKMDTETTLRRHDAIRKGLEASLGRYDDNPLDTVILDLLEEIVHQNISAGYSQEAFDIYWFKIGGYSNLGWRLGDYSRGDRICRMFVAGRPLPTVLPPAGLTTKDQAVFLAEWAIYLKDLGQLAAAVSCYEGALKIHMEKEKWNDASVENQVLAEIFLVAGRLSASLVAAESSLRTAECTNDPMRKWYSHAVRARARAYLGEVRDALSDFNDSRRWQRQIAQQPDRLSLHSMPGVQYALTIAWLGRVGEAIKLVEANQPLYDDQYGGDNSLKTSVILLLADLNRQQGNLAASRKLLYEAHRWALERDAKEQLCCAELVRARIELSSFTHKGSSNLAEAQASLVCAASALEDGLRIARECRFGIFHIDLLLVRAQLALHRGRVAEAERDVRAALNEGSYAPAANSGFPELPVAKDPQCLYAWGLVEGRHLLAEALLLQAAQKLGQAEFVPKRLYRLPADVRDLISEAREQLDQTLELWRKLRDPEAEADINPRGERTKRVLEGLEDGILTEYPLEPIRPEEPAVSSQAPESDRGTQPVTHKKHVFLSYCRENKAEVAILREDLIAAGEAVWWDQDILPGRDWKFEIRTAMRNAYAVVLCLSKETMARTTSGIYPEAVDAIAVYREYSPGKLFLIPVRLSDCEIPLIEIDGTRTLDRLQRADLFPPDQRVSGLGLLLKALQAAPLHR